MFDETQIWNLSIVVLSAFYIFVSILSSRKEFKGRLTFLFLLPSFVVPTIFILIYSIPLIWETFDKEFSISFLNEKYIDATVSYLFFCAAAIFSGHHIGKKKYLHKSRYTLPRRRLDVFLKDKRAFETTIFLTILAIVVFPFAFGLRVDLILNGGIRGLSVNNPILFALIPFARILLSILTIVSGVVFAKTNSKLVLLIPFLDLLQYLIKLSRGFFLPLILFLLSYGLSGKKVPSWFYMTIAFLGVIGGGIAIGARGTDQEGIQGFVENSSNVAQNFIGPIRSFFEANAFIGILSTCFAIRDFNQTSGPIEGFSDWLITVLPIPTFFGVTGSRLSVAEFLNITHVGIPMPTLGELYYQMGWCALIILFLYGVFLGNLEGKLINHVVKHGSSYWPDILVWLSAVLGIFLSIHSPTRSSSRLLLYSLALTFFCEQFLLKSSKNKSVSKDRSV